MQVLPELCDSPPRRDFEAQLPQVFSISSISGKWQSPLVMHSRSWEEKKEGFKERGGSFGEEKTHSSIWLSNPQDN